MTVVAFLAMGELSGGALERGRASYASRAWEDARMSLAGADQEAPLGADDLELLATSAYMVGPSTTF